MDAALAPTVTVTGPEPKALYPMIQVSYMITSYVSYVDEIIYDILCI